MDPASSLDALRDLRIYGGRIAEIGERFEARPDEDVIDARDAIVAPGFVDMHVHLREPGFPERETIETGTEAAVRGGFTSVACMPNTDPPLDDPASLHEIAQWARSRARCRVYPIATLTRGRAGREPSPYAELAAAGAVAFSDDGDTIEDERVMREAAARARDVAPPFIAHCEPEEEIVARDLAIAAETPKRWHIAHVSTARALEEVRAARARGVPVTCEVTPHHLTFTAALFETFGPAARVNPPLRNEEDVEALRLGVFDRTIDAFASDHAPHTSAQKSAEASIVAPGFSGLEVAAGAYAAALPDLPLARFVELIATNPARILGIEGGTLALGAPADVTIFADRSWVVDPASFASKGRCTPFAGRTLPRRILATIVGGLVRYRAAATPA